MPSSSAEIEYKYLTQFSQPRPGVEIPPLYIPPSIASPEAIFATESTDMNNDDFYTSGKIPFAVYGDLMYGRIEAPSGKYNHFLKSFSKSYPEKPIGAYPCEDKLSEMLPYSPEALASITLESAAYQWKDATPSTRKIYDIVSDSIVVAPGIEGVAENGMKTFVIFQDESSLMNSIDNPILLNGAAEELERRQALSSLHGKLEGKEVSKKRALDHKGMMLTTLANMAIILPHFYEKEVSIVEPVRSWLEVTLNDYAVIFDQHPDEKKKVVRCGQADIVIEGPDSQPITIEYGAPTPRKVRQSDKHNVGLEAVIRKANHGNLGPPVTSLLGSFWNDTRNNEWILHFRSPREIPVFPTS